MTLGRMVYVRCDGCGDPCDLADDSTEARSIARWRGWQRKGRRDLCPKCLGTAPADGVGAALPGPS